MVMTAAVVMVICLTVWWNINHVNHADINDLPVHRLLPFLTVMAVEGSAPRPAVPPTLLIHHGLNTGQVH